MEGSLASEARTGRVPWQASLSQAWKRPGKQTSSKDPTNTWAPVRSPRNLFESRTRGPRRVSRLARRVASQGTGCRLCCYCYWPVARSCSQLLVLVLVLGRRSERVPPPGSEKKQEQEERKTENKQVRVR